MAPKNAQVGVVHDFQGVEIFDVSRADKATDAFISSVMLGGAWRPALEQFASAAGAKAAALTRSTSTHLGLLPAGGMLQAYEDMRVGRAPRYSSKILILRRGDDGFRSDAAPHVRERLEREPFFRDYMKPSIDIPHRIAAWLTTPNDRCGVAISLYRGIRDGTFEPAEIERLNAFLPAFRHAAMLSQYAFVQREMEQSMFHQRKGEVVIKINFAGELLEESASVVAKLADPLRVVGRKLTTAVCDEQRLINALIHGALSEPKKSGAVPLTRLSDGARVFLLIVPIKGEASEVFAPVSAFGVLIDPTRHRQPSREAARALQSAVGLTDRETDVSALIAAGLSPRDIALQLGIGEGTVRTHLKLTMQKCGVHSQLELAALISRFE